MTAAASTQAVSWKAPGPGSWELDTTHFSPDCSRMVRDIMESGASRGFEAGMDRVGSPVKSIAMRFVNGRMYVALVPLIGARFNLPEPPTAVLKAVTRIHPEFRRRNERAIRAVRDRIWMEDFERWESEWRPELVARNRKLASFDVAAASNTELAAHLETVYGHTVDGIALHMQLHISDLGPIGLLLVEGGDLGLEHPEMMAALTGSSPATTAPTVALNELRRIVADYSGPKPTSLEEIRAISVQAAELLDEHLVMFGDRLTTGYDLLAQTLREMPHILVTSIVDVEAVEVSKMQEVGDEMAEALIAKVPEAHHTRLRQLIADARALYGLRDENSPITYQWSAGILRKAMLEAADRFIAEGRLDDRQGIFDLSAAEIAAFLRGSTTPTPAEISERTRERKALVHLEAPLALGPPVAEPPLEALPDGLGYLMRVILTVMGLIDAAPDVEAPAAMAHAPRAGELTGLGIGTATYVGRARVAATADEGMDKMTPGDVLIAPFTVPTYNAVLAIAGAVVVEQGGLLCHAAVIAREFGIPGVVGAAGALTAIPDGALVEVNAETGSIKVLAEA